MEEQSVCSGKSCGMQIFFLVLFLILFLCCLGYTIYFKIAGTPNCPECKECPSS